MEFLPFDTEHFGIRIFQLDVERVMPEIDWSEAELIYVNSTQHLDFKARSMGVKIDLRYDCQEDLGLVNQLEQIRPLQQSTEKLNQLALLAGQHSRFRKDKNLRHGFESLYKLWVLKSISGNFGGGVYGYYQGEELVAFYTLNENEDSCRIGLIAVDKKLQGKGIGRKLLDDAIQRAFRAMKPLFVATQASNVQAMQAYQKRGFKIYKQTHIYHIYKNDSV